MGMRRRPPRPVKKVADRPTLPTFRLACQQFEALAHRSPAFWWGIARMIEAHTRVLEALDAADTNDEENVKMGSLYRKTLASGNRSTIWRAKYYVHGRPIRVSTGTDNRKAAERFLKEREGRVAAGQPVLPRADRVRYDEVKADLRLHYQATGDRDLGEADSRLKHLDQVFTGPPHRDDRPHAISRPTPFAGKGRGRRTGRSGASSAPCAACWPSPTSTASSSACP